jgi:hypothetical protein
MVTGVRGKVHDILDIDAATMSVMLTVSYGRRSNILEQ